MTNKKIRFALNEKDMKYWELADLLDIDPSTLSRWLRKEMPEDVQDAFVEFINKNSYPNTPTPDETKKDAELIKKLRRGAEKVLKPKKETLKKRSRKPSSFDYADYTLRDIAYRENRAADLNEWR